MAFDYILEQFKTAKPGKPLTLERLQQLAERVDQGYPDYSPLAGTGIATDLTVGEFKHLIMAAYAGLHRKP